MCFLCFTAFFFAHKIVDRKEEEYFSAYTELDACSNSKLNAQLPFPCTRCRFVYGLSICGVLPEARKNLTQQT